MESGQAIGLRLARRDESALEEAYAAYGASLLAYLRRYVGPDEAEDVLVGPGECGIPGAQPDLELAHRLGPQREREGAGARRP